MNVWVERDDEGNVKGVFKRPQPGKAEERLTEDHPDVQAFKNRKPPESRLGQAVRAALDDPSLPPSVRPVFEEWVKEL